MRGVAAVVWVKVKWLLASACIVTLGACATGPSRSSDSSVAVASPQQVAAGRCELTAPSPFAPTQLGQFGFLVGDFTISAHAWTGNGWTPPRPVAARWNGWYGLGGMAIYDEWFDPAPAVDPNASRGVNVRYYDADAALWKMMWISTAGKQVQDLRAAVQDGLLTMWQVYPERPGWKAVFVVEDADRWHRISYNETAPGVWVEEFKLAATRVLCGSP